MGGSVSSPVQETVNSMERVNTPVQETVNSMEQVNTPPPTPAPPTPAEREVTFVQPTEVLVKLRETCKILEKHDNTQPKKEGYQMYNSDEIVGFNLK